MGLLFAYVLGHSVMSNSFEAPWTVAPPGSSVLGIHQARILEWAALSSSRGASPLRDRSWVSFTAGRFSYQLRHQGSPAGLIGSLLILYTLQCTPIDTSKGSQLYPIWALEAHDILITHALFSPFLFINPNHKTSM